MKKLLTNRKSAVFAAVIGLAVIGAAAFIAACGYIENLDKAFDKDSTKEIQVTIKPGTAASEIGRILEANGIVESAFKFKAYSKAKGCSAKYQAGTYVFSPSMKLSDIAEALMSGKTKEITFMVPEGYNICQIGEKLEKDGIVDGKTFNELLENGVFNYEFLKGAQKGRNHLEGYLFPETYRVRYGADEEEIIRIMLDQFDKVFTDGMEARAKEIHRSVNEIIIIASIIERESMVPEERGKVASVIYNRLAINMPLQMCSTVQYVLGKQKEVLTYADTETESPYNTYIHGGLPPGPICCPGLASIEAALYPEETDYLFFVVSDKLDGTQKFSSTIYQFERDKAAYYRALEGKN